MDKETEQEIELKLGSAILSVRGAQCQIEYAKRKVREAIKAMCAERAKKAPANG